MSIDRMINERLKDYAPRDEVLALRRENEALAERIAKLEGQRQMPEKQWYTVKDVALLMGKSESLVRKKFICTHKINAVWQGKGYKISADEYRRVEESIHVNSGCWKLEMEG